MVIGSIRWNILIGLATAFITFWAAIIHNVFFTAFVRALIAFTLFFVLSFALRWVMGLVIHWPRIFPKSHPYIDEQEYNQFTTAAPTPEGQASQKEFTEEEEFMPMKAADLAKAIRFLSDD